MDQFVELARSRRSVRKFTDESVPREDAARMLEAASCAPSGGNAQPWLFVAVDDREVILKCRKVVEDGIESLNSLLPGLAESDRKRLQGRLRSFSLFFSGAPVVIFAFVESGEGPLVRALVDSGVSAADAETMLGHVGIVSAAAAVENLLLAAHSMGYGACWMHPPFFAKEGIAGLLGVGSGHELMAIVPVGRPAERPAPPAKKPSASVSRFIPPSRPR